LLTDFDTEMMKKHIVTAFLTLMSLTLSAQIPDQVSGLISKYEFGRAAAILEPIVKADSLNGEVSLALVEALNGEALLGYAAKPVVVASKKVSRANFQLYYDHLKNGGWHDGGVYFEEGDSDLYLVINGKVCHSWLLDSLQWSEPERIVAESSDGVESWPLISYNGRDLYFSSDNLYGIGDSDIYVTSYDPHSGKWSTPSNLGMPFNSPADDLLFSETADGKYAVFASNRDCGADEVIIYVVRLENWLREKVSSSEALELSHLKVKSADEVKYSFVRLNPGGSLGISFAETQSENSYELTVGKVGSFVEDNSLPDGIVYQIQLFVTGKPASESQLKGISPVWCHKQSSGKYLYAAGLFRKYEDAATGLKQVKAAGLTSAYIIAFNNGKTMNINKARAAEKEVKVIQEEVHVVQ